MSKPKPNPFRDMPFPGAGGAWRCNKGALVQDTAAEKLTGLGTLCDAHDRAEAEPAAPRKAGKTTEPQE